MEWNGIRGHIVSWVLAGVHLPRRPLLAGIMCGLISGITLGAFTGPVGMTLGTLLGGAVGLVAGYTLAHDHETRARRTKELDRIIGITAGSIGAGPITIVEKPAPEDDDDAGEPLSTKEQWLAEWLTPPPPSVAR